jgi:hypothetical protein
MVVCTPLPKTIREAKTLHANSVGRVTAGSDATNGHIEVSGRRRYMDNRLDQNRSRGLRDSLISLADDAQMIPAPDDGG